MPTDTCGLAFRPPAEIDFFLCIAVLLFLKPSGVSAISSVELTADVIHHCTKPWPSHAPPRVAAASLSTSKGTTTPPARSYFVAMCTCLRHAGPGSGVVWVESGVQTGPKILPKDAHTETLETRNPMLVRPAIRRLFSMKQIENQARTPRHRALAQLYCKAQFLGRCLPAAQSHSDEWLPQL